jgi:hypothetical protein
MQFFVGLHQPSDAKHFATVMISVNRLEHRRSFAVQQWVMDSGAFTTLAVHGGYPASIKHYAAAIRRWRDCGQLLAAVTQDYMCEPFMLAKTGLTVAQSQRLTLERFDALQAADTGVYILPVLQGYRPHEYVAHLEQYGPRLALGAWVGVGTLCKRNGHPGQIRTILCAIHAVRPDLRLHGFSLKITALTDATIRDHLWSADSMAWSYQARKQGRNANDWQEALRFCQHIQTMPQQMSFF